MGTTIRTAQGLVMGCMDGIVLRAQRDDDAMVWASDEEAREWWGRNARPLLPPIGQGGVSLEQTSCEANAPCD